MKKTVFITGEASGIGAATVAKLTTSSFVMKTGMFY